MSRSLPPLVALRAFEAVARLGSVRKAAEELGVDHAAVGRHVKNLEAFLGTRLFDSGPRGTRPTPDGRRYAHQVGLAFDVIGEATDALKPRSAGGELRIWCVPGLAARWLMPRLKALETAIRDREIVLRPTDQAPDLLRGEADVEIRFRERPVAGVSAEPLATPRYFPVASPAFLAGRPAPVRAADLARLPLIHEESREQWRHWLAAAGLDPVPALDGPRLWYANVAIEAALMGQGVVLVNPLQIEAERADGRLVELMRTDIRIGAYVIQIETGRWSDPVMVKLRRWLKDEMARSLAADASLSPVVTTGHQSGVESASA
ncbi:LysR substrate-binding domain-containing protein [Chthonobacter rhizosphaerae]|uniref:LysR substrate-binding domain-containing protein n=1 Tax=Chthonobacter rhizosphaerae TaxID=2735553 RepID=UPI0015EE4C1F|nr:LysR substrate-binding domain-containing protein [Chthonobacter rhizosphaerae]